MPFKDKKKQRKYMAAYMKEYRKMQQKAIKIARQMGFNTKVKRTQKPKKSRRR